MGRNTRVYTGSNAGAHTGSNTRTHTGSNTGAHTCCAASHASARKILSDQSYSMRPLNTGLGWKSSIESVLAGLTECRRTWKLDGISSSRGRFCADSTDALAAAPAPAALACVWRLRRLAAW